MLKKGSPFTYLHIMIEQHQRYYFILFVNLFIILILTMMLRFNYVRGPLGDYINRCLSDATRDVRLHPFNQRFGHTEQRKRELTKIEASTIRNPQTPLTLKSGFTTPNPAFSAVIAAVPMG